MSRDALGSSETRERYFSQDDFCLGRLTECQFRRSLEIVPRPEPREGGTDAIEYAVCRRVLLLVGEFHGPKVICHEVIRGGLEDRIEILVGGREFALADVDVGAAQMGQQIIGIDLERLVVKTHGPVRIAPGRSISPFTWRISAERGLSAIASSISRSASAGFVPVRNRASWTFGFAAPGIQPDRIAQQCFGLVPITHTGCRGAEGGADLAFESGVPIARLDQIEDVREFFLTKQSISENR